MPTYTFPALTECYKIKSTCNALYQTSDSLANVQSNSTEVQGSSACVKKGYWDISAEYYVSTHCNSFKVYKL